LALVALLLRYLLTWGFPGFGKRELVARRGGEGMKVLGAKLPDI